MHIEDAMEVASKWQQARNCNPALSAGKEVEALCCLASFVISLDKDESMDKNCKHPMPTPKTASTKARTGKMAPGYGKVTKPVPAPKGK